MTAPERIWARSSKCERGGRDPFGDFRLTKIEKPDWHDRHRYHDQEEYVRADLHDATKAQLDKAWETCFSATNRGMIAERKLAKAVEALREIVNTEGLFGAAMKKTNVDTKIRAVLAEIKKGGV